MPPPKQNFVKRDDFLRFLKDDVQACFKLAEQLSERYHDACNEVRSLGLSHSAHEKLANLLLEWGSKNGEAAKPETRLRLRRHSRGNCEYDRHLARNGYPAAC